MKFHRIAVIVALLFFIILPDKLVAGSRVSENPPYAVQGILGTDRIIDPSSIDTQTDIRVATAKNGWVFVAYIRANGTANAGIKIKRTKDNGQSWKNVCSVLLTNESFVSGLDLTVCGNDSASLVLYLISADHNLSTGKYTLFINKYDANTGTLLSNCFTDANYLSYPIMDCAMASDYLYPSIASNPYSIGAVYSLRGNPQDSIIFVYSVDGGNTFTRQLVDTTWSYFGRVSIAYGKSLSQPNGKYFVAYEKRIGTLTKIGGIRTSHTSLFPGSSFSTPFQIDTIVGATTNVCSWPSIACQIDAIDNDSSDLTTVVTVERDFNGMGSNHDVLGFVNKNSKSNYWERFNVLTGSSSNAKQPQIIFDHINDKFLMTYWDSTSGKIPLTYKDINFTSPNTWHNLISQVNDTTANMEDAKPHISLSPTNARTNIVWISGGKNVEGVAYFDSNVSIVGIDDEENTIQQIVCFPNPADNQVTISFILAESNSLNLEITDLTGRIVQKSIAINFFPGRNNFKLQTENLPNGYYLARVNSNKSSFTNKLIISHR